MPPAAPWYSTWKPELPPDQLVAVAKPLATTPGAPPVRVVSVVDQDGGAIYGEGQRGPHDRQRQRRARRQRGGRRRGQLVPAAVVPQEQHELGAAAVPRIDTDVHVLAPGLGADGRADPLAAGELGGRQLDLGELVAGVALGGADVTGVAPGVGPLHLLVDDGEAAVGHVGPVGAEAPVGPGEIVRGDGGPSKGRDTAAARATATGGRVVVEGTVVVVVLVGVVVVVLLLGVVVVVVGTVVVVSTPWSWSSWWWLRRCQTSWRRWPGRWP